MFVWRNLGWLCSFLLVNGSGRRSAPQESSLHVAALCYISGFRSLARNKLMLNSQAPIRCEAEILQLGTLQAPNVCTSVVRRLVFMVFADG